MKFLYSKLYPIIDVGTLDITGISLREVAVALREADVTLLQYRNKTGVAQAILRAAAEIADIFEGADAALILNDRADLALLAGWSGVHVGQNDLSPMDARRVLGVEGIVGISTHSDEQVIAADAGDADYIAVGPVFSTSTKLNASPVVGLEGVRRARALTSKPMVAIGGITRRNARSVIDAGADSVAVINGLFQPGERLAKVARDFIELLR